MTRGPTAIGPDVSAILVSTDAGSVVAQNVKPGEPVRIVAPSAATERLEVRAIRTDNGTAGDQFALAEVQLSDAASGADLPIRQAVVLPDRTADVPVTEWVLHNELGARPQCVDGVDDEILCAGALGLAPETPGVFTRTLSAPEQTTVEPTVVLRPTPSGALSELLAEPGRIRAEGPAAVADVRGSAVAAVDGDPSTTWVAPEPTDRKASKPTLRLHLPDDAMVDGLKLRSRDGYPARPTEVVVDLGTGKQKRKVGDDGVVRLAAARTSQISLQITDTEDLLDTNDLGFTTRAPAGISEIEVLGAEPPQPTDADREVVIGCDTDPAGPLGLGLTASGRLLRLELQTTAGDLRAGRPVIARPCPGPPLELAAGTQELAVNPGEAFTVDAVSLTSDDTARPAASPPSSAPMAEWNATHRQATVDAADRDRVLSVPESTNSGWRAKLDGTPLTPITVDGWQQGWLIPAGAAGTVSLDFAFDGLYRWSLLIGLLLLAVLLVLAVVPTSRTSTPPSDEAPTLVPVHFVAAVGAAATAWLVAGWWGLLVAALAAAATSRMGRNARVVAVFTGMFAATVLLAAGPWHSGTAYTGYDVAPQLCALVSLSILAASALIPLRQESASVTMDPCRESETP